jgi:hypothetical protein
VGRLIHQCLATCKERFLSGTVNTEVLRDKMHCVAVDVLHGLLGQVEVLSHFRMQAETLQGFSK